MRSSPGSAPEPYPQPCTERGPRLANYRMLVGVIVDRPGAALARLASLPAAVAEKENMSTFEIAILRTHSQGR